MLAPRRNLEAALRGLRSMARVYYDAEPPAESQRKNGMGEFSIRMRFWPVGRFGLAGQIPSRPSTSSRVVEGTLPLVLDWDVTASQNSRAESLTGFRDLVPTASG